MEQEEMEEKSYFGNGQKAAMGGNGMKRSSTNNIL